MNKRIFLGSYGYESMNYSGKEQFPLILETIEEDLFLNLIIPRIGKKRLDLPVIVIHDPLVTTQRNVEYVKESILKGSKKILGFEPKLKKEDWG